MVDTVGTAATLSLPVSRREILADAIIDLFVEGTHLSVERLTSENELCGLLPGNPSRTPVREALTLLVRDGVLEQIPKEGVRVRPLSLAELEEEFAARRGLENLMVRRLALREIMVDLTKPQEALDLMKEAIRGGDLAALGSADVAFHSGLARVAQMRSAENTLRSTISRLRLAATGCSMDVAQAQREQEASSAVLQAIGRHDASGASDAIRQVLNLAEIRTKQFI